MAELTLLYRRYVETGDRADLAVGLDEDVNAADSTRRKLIAAYWMIQRRLHMLKLPPNLLPGPMFDLEIPEILRTRLCLTFLRELARPPEGAETLRRNVRMAYRIDSAGTPTGSVVILSMEGNQFEAWDGFDAIWRRPVIYWWMTSFQTDTGNWWSRRTMMLEKLHKV